MGYTTNFSGHITISPPASSTLIDRVNKFCETRHGGNTDPFPDMPGFWCDFEGSPNGTKLSWNGSEKSYDMDLWLKVLIDRFFLPARLVLNGELLASGEEHGDVWKLCVKDNVVSVRRMPRDW